jgi:predicted dehydrogenase
MVPPVRLGIVGTGAVSRRHAAAIALNPEFVHITAIADANAGAASAFAADFGDIQVFADLEELAASGEIDAAIVATPHFLHFEQALRLVEAGIPVLVEKPLVTNMNDLRTLRAAAAQYGTLVVAGQMRRFDPENVLARRWTQADPSRFGQMTTFNMRSWQDITAYTEHVGLSHWLLDGTLAGGGVVVSLAVHQLDVVRFLGGADYASVTAIGAFTEPFHSGAEATASVLITMTNGAMGTLHSTYNAPRGFQSESLSVFGEHGGFSRDFRPKGDYEGSLLYSPAHSEDIIDFSSVEPVGDFGLIPELVANPFENQIIHFARAINGEVEPINTIADNFNTIACVAAINQALHNPGTTVHVETA